MNANVGGFEETNTKLTEAEDKFVRRSLLCVDELRANIESLQKKYDIEALVDVHCGSRDVSS